MSSRFILLIFALGLWLAGPGARAQCLDPFTRELLESGDGFRALTRMKEREFLARSKPQGRVCARQILKLYVDHREFEAADSWLSQMSQHYFFKTDELIQLQAELAFVFGNFSEAQARAERGEFNTKNVLLFSARVLAEPQADLPLRCAERPCQALGELREKSLSQGRKSTALALAFGIVPGAGQMYAGRWGAGFASLLLNSFLIGLTLYAQSRGELALSWLTGVGAVGTYSASIYAGYESARRQNEVWDRQFRDRAERLNFGWRLLEWSW